MSGFTGILAVISDVAGADAATKLALKAGGTEFKFSAQPNGKLAKLVGAKAAAAIVGELGAQKYAIPMAHLRGEKARRSAAARMLAEGGSANDVAMAVDVHERTVRRVRERMKKSAAQRDLFNRD